MSEKSGTNGNFNYFSYFYLQVKVKGQKAKNGTNIGWKGGHCILGIPEGTGVCC
jgi:hypothetical protein